MLKRKTPEFRSLKDFCIERGLAIPTSKMDRNLIETIIGMYLAGVASETFYPCFDRAVHETVH